MREYLKDNINNLATRSKNTNIRDLYRRINEFKKSYQLINVNQDSVVGIVTGCRLDDGGVGVRVPVESRIFFSPRPPDRLWGPPSLLSNGYQELFPWG
jgi:hypothetical protein